MIHEVARRRRRSSLAEEARMMDAHFVSMLESLTPPDRARAQAIERLVGASNAFLSVLYLDAPGIPGLGAEPVAAAVAALEDRALSVLRQIVQATRDQGSVAAAVPPGDAAHEQPPALSTHDLGDALGLYEMPGPVRPEELDVYDQIEAEELRQIAKGRTPEGDDARSREDWISCLRVVKALRTGVQSICGAPTGRK